MRDRTAIYPGTFDPPTLGHLDVIETASRLFDRLVVVVSKNPSKDPAFSSIERVYMLEAALFGLVPKDVVEVIESEAMTTEIALEQGAGFTVRGLRLTTEYDAELNRAMNLMAMDPEFALETILIPPRQEHIHVSSTVAREILKFQGRWSSALENYLHPTTLEIMRNTR